MSKKKDTTRRARGVISPPRFFLPVIKRKHFSSTQAQPSSKMNPTTNARMGALLFGTNKRYAEANPQSRVKRLSTIPTGHLNPARKFDFADVLSFGDIYEVRLNC